MAAVKTVNFLPAVFRSDTNTKFLNATLDQLVSQPDLRKINGYIGRTFAPTFKSTDNYQPEPSSMRQNYQLEPSVVVKNSAGNVDFFSSYIDLLQQIDYYGGITDNQSRMFAGESYSFDGLFDFDKFVNFNQYYWLPDGPDAVQVYGNKVDTSATFKVTRDPSSGTYHFSGYGTAENPTLRLARGGTYKFVIDQPGYPFWIQSQPGVSGTRKNQSNFSTRDVLGVTNNGTDSGEITFTIPQATGQDYYVRMPLAATVDVATTLTFSDLSNRRLSDLIANGGIDGIISNLENKTVIFIGENTDDIFWTSTGLFDLYGFNGDNAFDSSGIVNPALRRNVWRIKIIEDGVDQLVTLIPDVAVGNEQKVYVKSGNKNGEQSYYKPSDTGIYKAFPDITAPLAALYYQDGVSKSFVGQVDLVDPTNSQLDVDINIIGKATYTSPNGITFTNGMKVQFDSSVIPASYANNTYYVEGVGTAIRLINETDLQTPEPYAVNGLVQDYITINRASIDLNPWSRSNRWFHIDVIKTTAAYNNTVPVLNQNQRANRPIVEFEPNLQLFNFGRVAKTPVDILDFDVIDAFNSIEIQSTFTLNGVVLKDGMRVIFANDFDPNVRNKIHTVNLVSIGGRAVINLTPTDDAEVLPNNNLIVLQGGNAGKEYWYNGSIWLEGQQKNGVNQEPLFDVVDTNRVSFGNTSKYPSTTFAGTKIFSYRRGSGSTDSVLGFPLSYRNFNQIGDIQFDNNFDADTFSYTGQTQQLNSGLLRQNTDLTDSVLRNTWVKNKEDSKQFQILGGVYDGYNPFFEIDIDAVASVTVPYFRVYKNSQLLDSTQYQKEAIGVRTYIRVTDSTLAKGDRIDILIYSDKISSSGYYEVPKNLDLNTENKNFSTLTLGQLRNHLSTMAENSNQLTGSVPGSSNLRDVPVKSQGGSIVQHASPVLYSELFLVDPDVNFFKGLELSRHEYSKIKNKFLELSTTLTTIDPTNVPATVDTILKTINAVKNSSFAWYYSDMVPYGDVKNVIEYQIVSTELRDYEISSLFDDTKLSNRAVLVYINNKQLVKDYDYTFDDTRAGFTISADYPLSIGDTITINEYSNTDGNYIPETPTKLGLYPKFKPSMYLDDTYQTPTYVIQGHDGSITPAFGDYRDELLLELETRIYNNIKVNYQTNVFDIYNFMPGKFRTTDYTNDEFNRLLTKSFLRWAGSNRVDFTNNTYFVESNPWTWNYRRFVDTINKEPLPGTWRAIFKYFYDTDRPHTHPWEMLGFTEQPSWWIDRYGAAPYTGGNLVLWGDLEKGYIHAGERAGIDERFARPGLLKIIPVNDYGELRSPNEFAVSNFNSNDANVGYAVGNQGPVETAWRRSSDFPYAVQAALALSHPAFYFGTLMNVGRYYKNTDIDQYVLNNSLQRITPTSIELNGRTVDSGIERSAGYLNWIAEYLRNIGINPSVKITEYLTQVSVQLAYKMAGFSDKSLIEVIAEQSSPTSTNSGVVVPNENYQIALYKSTPTSTIVYSAVIVERSDNGYTVSGYDLDNPYFTIIPSLANNNAYSVRVLNDMGVIYKDYQKYKVTVPYGFEFSNKQQVVDFLVSYERYLKAIGVRFEEFDTDLEEQRNFTLSVKEFLLWSQQGWASGSILVLSPILSNLVVNTTSGVVDEIKNTPSASRVLDANFNFIKSNQFTVMRDGNRFSIGGNYTQTIALAVLEVVEYEHALIFDNTTVFNDIIYKPELGNRQYRLKLVGSKTGSWSGQLNPPGFIYNNPKVDEWTPGTDFKKGSLVTFKGVYYAAISDLVGSTDFVPSQWRQLTSNEIKTGLLPNFSYNAQKFNNYFDLDNPAVEGGFDEYSNRVIGFQPRQYLTDFGIDKTTQAKFYQGFIRDKGTINAVNAFTAAGFNGVTSSINLYEEWAIRVGEYGSLENNKFAEVQLLEGKFAGSPITFTLLNDGETASDKIIGVYPADSVEAIKLYKSSNGYEPTIYTNRDGSSDYENDLPTAGYVNENDVDATIFNIGSYSQLNNKLAEVYSGYKIWTARDFSGEWNVYRVTETNLNVVAMTYNIDNLATVTTDTHNTFAVGDLIVIKGFDSRADGFYQVYELIDSFNFSVVVPTSVLPQIKTAQNINGIGPIFKLVSMRITRPIDITSITPAKGWIDNDKLWVDNDNGQWSVYNKTTPWSGNLNTANVSMLMDSNVYVSNSGFGKIVTINNTGTFAAAGMPNLGNNKGNVAVFVSNIANNNTLTYVGNLGATHSSVNYFGSSLDTAGNLLFVGNPGNGTSEYGRVHVHRFDGVTSFPWTQSITSNWGSNVGNQFGYSVSSSADGTWLFVSAPNKGNVEVFHANATGYYTYANTITVGSSSSSAFGYTVKTTSDASQTIIGAPYEAVGGYAAAGAVYVYDRSIESFISNAVSDAFGYTVVNNINPTTVRVTVNGTVLTSSQYTITGNNNVKLTTAPAHGAVVTIETNKFQLMEKVSAPKLSSGSAFGTTAHISGNDADIYVSSPEFSEPGYYSGIVYRYVNQGAAYGEVSGTVVNPTVTAGHGIRINGRLVTFSGTTLANVVADINSANIVGITANISGVQMGNTMSGVLALYSNISVPYSKLVITPGVGTALNDLGVNVYVNTQSIRHPEIDSVNQFGSAVVSSTDSRTLVVSATSGTTYNITSWDQVTTLFDTGSTSFFDKINGAGVVYVYGLVGGSLSGTAKDQYVLTQRLENYNVQAGDQFGYCVAMNGNTMLIGAPGDSHTMTSFTANIDTGKNDPIKNAGTFYTYDSFGGNVGWDVLRSEQPKVDIDSITRMYLYDTVSNTILTNLDYIDPAKGKVLGAALQDINFLTGYDPAVYNAAGGIDGYAQDVAVSVDFHWGSRQVGKTWWDLTKVSFVDYEQDSLIYRSAKWGSIFPGSTVEIAEWVESAVPPSQYAGDGTPKYLAPNDSYCMETYVDPVTKVVRTHYYFWVINKNSVDTDKTNRTNTIVSLQDMIVSPQTQGIPYAAVLRNDTISLYGVNNMITGNATVLHIDYDTIKNENIIHSEYQLIQEGNSNSLVPDRIVEKMKDSLAGADIHNLPVPDPTLSVQNQTGIDNKPRQSIFVNRLQAVKNWIEYVNNILIEVPVLEEFIIDPLYSAEAVPAATTYNIEVASYTELGYIDTALISNGYLVLVKNDETQNNLWAVYSYAGLDTQGKPKWNKVSVQSYYTPFYWYKTDWYDSSFDPTVKPTYVVATTNDLQTLTPPSGSIVKVTNNGRGQFEVYLYGSNNTKSLVGIENGTIQFSNSLYDANTSAATEIRIIFDALQNNIFIKTLKANFNQMFFFLVNYIIAEQKNVDWIFKTSFVSILHQLRKLEQFPNYIKDNQTYYESYIDEVKPYRTSLREYLLDYQSLDQYSGDVTDFDLPASYNKATKTYRSPDGTLSTDATTLSTTSVYNPWYKNHSYSIYSVELTNGGDGYTLEPTVHVVGGGGTGAEVKALVDYTTGTLTGFEVVKSGQGYTSNPSIVIIGTGTGAAGYARLTGEYFVQSVPTQSIATESNVTVYAGNLILQPNTGAAGTVSVSSTGNIITVVDVTGTFKPNQYLFSESANLQVRAGIASEILNIDANVSLHKGNVITQPATGAVGEVLYNSTGNVVTLWNTSGVFTSNQYIYSDSANLHIRPNSSVTFSYNAITSYVQFEDKSYKKVRTFDSYLKFDRIGSTALRKAIVTLNANVTVNAGDRVGQQVVLHGALENQQYFLSNAVVASGVTNSNVVTLINVSGTISNTANLIINGSVSNAVPRTVQMFGDKQASYSTVVADWQPNVAVWAGNIVSYNGSAYRAIVTTADSRFDYNKYQHLTGDYFDNANDRIMALYQPTNTMPPKDLKKLINGLEYGGVNVTGIKYNAVTSTVNSQALYYFSNAATLFSSNISQVDFVKLKYTKNQPLTITNHNTGATFKAIIGEVAHDNLMLNVVENNGLQMPPFTLGSNITLSYYDFNDPNYMDTVIQSSYLDTALGTRPEDINLDGGSYIDVYNSHAPEELVPGTLYDSLNMSVYTRINSNTKVVAYRIEHNMRANSASSFGNVQPQYYKIDSLATTQLASNLHITDTTIHVVNSSVLSSPNPELNLPGIVYINGEKIWYYSKDDTTNTLGRLRRAVDGTGAPIAHAVGSDVVESSQAQLIPGSDTHTGTWLNPSTGQATIIVDNFSDYLDDNLSDTFVTSAPIPGAITDGLGLEGSTTIQARFLKGLL